MGNIPVSTPARFIYRREIRGAAIQILPVAGRRVAWFACGLFSWHHWHLFSLCVGLCSLDSEVLLVSTLVRYNKTFIRAL